MPGVLVIAESRRGELRDVSFELIGAALGLAEQGAGTVSVALIDAHAAARGPALGSDGVNEVLAVTSPVPEFEAHIAQRALVELIEHERPGVVIAAHSIDALGFAPAVAAVKRLGFASDVTAMAWEGGLIATRGAFGDKLVAQCDFPGQE